MSITGSLADTIGQKNPFRYRSYYYDWETGWYYLNSRYYDPEVGRFINADSIIGANGGIQGYNLFAYCNNNPVMYKDCYGYNADAAIQWSSSMWWLTMVDGYLPCGDIIYGGVFVVLLVTSEIQSSDNTSIVTNNAEHLKPKVVTDTDEHEVEHSPDMEEPEALPQPDFSDDDYDYDDDSNYGGREKIGKNKGKTPRDNLRQNKQFRDATRGLSKRQQRRIHDMITRNGLDFHEIVEIISMLLGK